MSTAFADSDVDRQRCLRSQTCPMAMTNTALTDSETDWTDDQRFSADQWLWSYVAHSQKGFRLATIIPSVSSAFVTVT